MKELSSEMLNRQLNELAAFEPNGFPFVSLYLNAQADRHGRDNFARFVRREFTRRARTFPVDSIERLSFERDAARIEKILPLSGKAIYRTLRRLSPDGRQLQRRKIKQPPPIQSAGYL